MYQCEFMKLPIERPRIPDVFRVDDFEVNTEVSSNIPASADTIDMYSFSDTALTEVTLPENCT